jgi:hypothetical protein
MTTAASEINEKIIEETDQLAQQYSESYADDPLGELRAWLEIAARREAMVREVYGRTQRDERLPGTDAGAGRAAWDVITEIWQQEATHTTLIQSRLADGFVELRSRALGSAVLALMGQVEGRVLCALTGARPSLAQRVARALTAVGAVLTPERVPDFARELTSLNTRDFFLLAQALELTARQSYERMGELLGQIIDQRAHAPSIQLPGLRRALANVRREEEFHEAAFEAMSGWLDADGNFDPAREEAACILEVADLAPRATFDGRSNVVLTDGGLGALFARHGITLVVMPA